MGLLLFKEHVTVDLPHTFADMGWDDSSYELEAPLTGGGAIGDHIWTRLCRKTPYSLAELLCGTLEALAL